MGKTQLAIAFAKRYRESFSSIFWLNAESEGSLREQFVSMARRLRQEKTSNRIDNGDNGDGLIEYFRGWLSNSGNTRWMLIFDNHDDPRGTLNGFEIRKYFPYRLQGSILITTRSTELRVDHLIKVEKLDFADARTLLLQRSERLNSSRPSDLKGTCRTRRTRCSLSS